MGNRAKRRAHKEAQMRSHQRRWSQIGSLVGIVLIAALVYYLSIAPDEVERQTSPKCIDLAYAQTVGIQWSEITPATPNGPTGCVEPILGDGPSTSQYWWGVNDDQLLLLLRDTVPRHYPDYHLRMAELRAGLRHERLTRQLTVILQLHQSCSYPPVGPFTKEQRETISAQRDIAAWFKAQQTPFSLIVEGWKVDRFEADSLSRTLNDPTDFSQHFLPFKGAEQYALAHPEVVTWSEGEAGRLLVDLIPNAGDLPPDQLQNMLHSRLFHLVNELRNRFLIAQAARLMSLYQKPVVMVIGISHGSELKNHLDKQKIPHRFLVPKSLGNTIMVPIEPLIE